MDRNRIECSALDRNRPEMSTVVPDRSVLDSNRTDRICTANLIGIQRAGSESNGRIGIQRPDRNLTGQIGIQRAQPESNGPDRNRPESTEQVQRLPLPGAERAPRGGGERRAIPAGRRGPVRGVQRAGPLDPRRQPRPDRVRAGRGVCSAGIGGGGGQTGFREGGQMGVRGRDCQGVRRGSVWSPGNFLDPHDVVQSLR